MKISQLIKTLSFIEKQHGDIEVMIRIGKEDTTKEAHKKFFVNEEYDTVWTANIQTVPY